MEQSLFTQKYLVLKERGQVRDALWNDWTSEEVGYPEQFIRRELLIAASDDFQSYLTELIEHNELTSEQILSLETIVFQTENGSDNIEPYVGHIEVLEPFIDGYEGTIEAFGKFQASLLGFGAYRVKGSSGEYMPVRIDRNFSAENDSYFEPLLSHFQRLLEVYHAEEKEEA